MSLDLFLLGIVERRGGRSFGISLIKTAHNSLKSVLQRRRSGSNPDFASAIVTAVGFYVQDIDHSFAPPALYIDASGAPAIILI
jgi:hypothetical protein